MSGSLPIAPLPPLVSHTSVPLHLPTRPAPSAAPVPGGTAFQSLMAGAPAPALVTAPSLCMNPSGQVHAAALAPVASRLPVAPGPQATGRTLAAADLSMAAWPAPVAGGFAGIAALASQVEAVRPVSHAGLAATQRLLPSFT
ncbi:MAG: hypothetical protein RI884_677 [Pseudomonadota bacterium]